MSTDTFTFTIATGGIRRPMLTTTLMKNRYEKKYRGRPIFIDDTFTHTTGSDFTFRFRADRARAEESAREKFKRTYEARGGFGRRFGEEPPRTRQVCPHSVLGVACDSSRQVLRTAYRRLAKEVHPDIAASQDAHKKMVRLNRAYEAAIRELQ